MHAFDSRPPPLVHLDPDHPGFRDGAYRKRRDQIAKLALQHKRGQDVADAPYTGSEHRLWQKILARLAPLHRQMVCRELLEKSRLLALPPKRIPGLEEISQRLAHSTGFRMEPVQGLVAPRAFLAALGEKVFLSTQYMRHTSRPWYTPEPDVVHELVGHAASLSHPEIARLNRIMGTQAKNANDATLRKLERVYWHSFEFGLVWEEGRVKAFGAGLLSSVGELQKLQQDPLIRPWNLDQMAETAYDPTDYQPLYFLAPSFKELLGSLERWLGELGDGRGAP